MSITSIVAACHEYFQYYRMTNSIELHSKTLNGNKKPKIKMEKLCCALNNFLAINNRANNKKRRRRRSKLYAET